MDTRDDGRECLYHDAQPGGLIDIRFIIKYILIPISILILILILLILSYILGG